MIPTRSCSDLDHELDSLLSDGYRLDMIMPADAPREAILSKDGDALRLVLSPAFRRPKSIVSTAEAPVASPNNPSNSVSSLELPAKNWTKGRAEMEYRDLMPGRLDGRLVASHIRINNGGEVPDYVHYHKIGFQMIYCKSGWVRVVYEDQGPPFVLSVGDCVLQPPGIRHRVLEASAGTEVIEVSSPAEHETWVDHEMILPTANLLPDRDFGGQRFVRHVAAQAEWDGSSGIKYRDTGIRTATGIADVRVVKADATNSRFRAKAYPNGMYFIFVLKGSARLSGFEGENRMLLPDDSFILSSSESLEMLLSTDAELLDVALFRI
ncbi:MAG TPA: cupin domain-containing protein [Pyrinomonadaceae bacterium]